MPEPRKQRVECYMFTSDLILAVSHAVQANPLDVGVYYAEKLEEAARQIREGNKKEIVPE